MRKFHKTTSRRQRRQQEQDVSKHTLQLAKQVGMSNAEMAKHIWILGRSGMGKSRCMMKMLGLLMQKNAKDNGGGFCLIDPAGQVFDYCLAEAAKYPEIYKDRLYVIDMTRDDRIPAINPLDQPGKMTILSQKQQIFRSIQKVYNQEGEVFAQMQRMFTLSLPLLLEEHRYLSFRDIVDICSTQSITRDAVLTKLQVEGRMKGDSPILKDWAELEQKENRGEAFTMLRSAKNRAGEMVYGEEEARLFSLPSMFDFQTVIEKRGIVLVKLAKGGQFSDEIYDIIGTFIIDKIVNAAFCRKPETGPQFFLAIDEFSRFVNSRDIERTFDQLRQRRVAAIIANQYCHQLIRDDGSQKLLQSVIANTNIRILFSISATDAKILGPELYAEELAADQVLDEVWTKMFKPVESQRTVVSETRGGADSVGEHQSEGEGETEGESITETETEGYGGQRMVAQGKSRANSVSDAEIESWAESDTEGEGESYSFNESGSFAQGAGESLLFTGDTSDPIVTQSSSVSEGFQSGVGESQSLSKAHTSSEGGGAVHGVTDTEGESLTVAEGENWLKSLARSRGRNRSTSRTRQRGTDRSHADNYSISRTVVSYTEYVEELQRVSTTYRSQEAKQAKITARLVGLQTQWAMIQIERDVPRAFKMPNVEIYDLTDSELELVLLHADPRSTYTPEEAEIIQQNQFLEKMRVIQQFAYEDIEELLGGAGDLDTSRRIILPPMPTRLQNPQPKTLNAYE